MRFVFRRALLACLAVVAGLLLTSCAKAGGDQTTAAAQTTVPAAKAAAPAAKVSANQASEQELATAFEAAGIPNARKWAEEVTEYRPYDEPTFAKLRRELAKYNPAPGVVDKIIATLEL